MPETIRRNWAPVGAWAAAAPPAGRLGAEAGAAGVLLQPLDHSGLSTIIVRSGRRERFASVVADRWGVALPGTGEVAFGETGDLVWSGPDQWLAVAHGADDLHDLPRALEGIAAVTDQGDGRALVVIGGPAARRMLAKVLAIDLHPSVFLPGRAAVTVVAHVGAQIWLRPNGTQFVMAVPRTSAGSTWAALTAAAAEFGCDVRPISSRAGSA